MEAVTPTTSEMFTTDEMGRPVDLVHLPSHYTRMPIQPKTYIVRNGMEFWRGNAIKYASRAGHKLYPGKDAVQSEITDLQKAIECLQWRINMLNGEMEL